MVSQKMNVMMKKMIQNSNNFMKTRAVIVAAGVGKRFGSPNKVFMPINYKPLFIWATEPFEKNQNISSIWIVTRRQMIKEANQYVKKFKIKKVEKIIEGGKERQDSVYNALLSLPDDTDIVLIHDAARPLVSNELINRVLKALSSNIDGVIPAISIADTVKWINRKNIVITTLNRDVLKAVQTPQAFWFKKLLYAYKKAYKEHFYGTDDSSLLERYGGAVITVSGDVNNFKITTKDDIQRFENLVNSENLSEKLFQSLRIGIGYDSHRLTEGRKLIIGGVEIPYERGLQGHSDADVLIHAIIDALLGAAGLGDIGKHFPDNDPSYKDISSMTLLEKTMHLLSLNGIVPLWIDCTIFAEKPKMLLHIPKMQKNLSRLGLNVNIKAKTNEGMGFIGRLEGIAAQAVCICRCVK